MSQNIKVTESPKHFMVIDAISRGIRDAGKIARVTKINKSEVEMILNDLAVQMLIVVEQKKGFFGKKIHASITETGVRLLSLKKQELEEKTRDLEGVYMNRDRRGIQSFMDDNRAWIPMMIFSGIMSAMVFASMMSFMGMAMNPAEASYGGRCGKCGCTRRRQLTLSHQLTITATLAPPEEISAQQSLLALMQVVEV